ncbi:hypothetical protein [Paenibacillus kribbensis]|uniref:hypothetical protein n=1 Tax=Paenibacillus kribbensis TaxID=172713 RepID=UPI00083934D6|nr:hypothetical protein [Paenibacillus kribbensis]
MKNKLKRFIDSPIGRSVWFSVRFIFEIAIFTGLIFLAYQYLSGKVMEGMTVAQYHETMSLFQRFEKPDSAAFRNIVLLLFGYVLVGTVYACIRSTQLVKGIEIKQLKRKIQELEACQE